MDTVQLDADRIEWAAARATAEGNVAVVVGTDRLTGVRATWDGHTLVVEEGVLTRPDGELRFSRAEVVPDDARAVLLEARVETGGATVTTERLAVGETWQASTTEVEPCACADGKPGALSFKAARVEVVPGEVVTLHGAVIRLFGVPVLPVPWWRVPLDPGHFRVLLPEVSWGEDGAAVKVLGRGGVGAATVTGGPAWRQDRGLRGELSVAAPTAGGSMALGWDAEAGKARGVLGSKGGFDASNRAAWELAVVSDADYLADYSVDYVARGVAWREERVAFDLGPTRGAIWLPDDGSAGVLAREGVAWRLRRGTMWVEPRADAALVGHVGDFGADASIGDEVLRPLGSAGVAAGWSGGRVVHVEATADLSGAIGGFPSETLPGWGDGLAAGPVARRIAPGLGGAARVEATLPVWSRLGTARFQWNPGVRAEGIAGWTGEFTGAARAGPAVRVASEGDTFGVSADGALLWDGSEVRPALLGEVHGAVLSGAVSLESEVQSASIAVNVAPVTVLLGTTRADALWLAWGDTSVAWRRLRVGGGLAWDLDGAGFTVANGRIGYDDGCAALTLNASFAADRTLPDVGLAATLRR